ncbi:Parvalbumin [Trema orientale]|uniref:Parvalbumin n=1 Tax=Trema orientale TaxID=63057 RepID=A0A2P5CLZ9_TREOI|nr:Parvalbumin [Trema orientale]
MAELKEERAQCERIFRRFDANGDGKISWAELADALKALGLGSPDEVRSRMAEIDKDSDGFISLEELYAFQCANPELMKHVFNKL